MIAKTRVFKKQIINLNFNTLKFITINKLLSLIALLRVPKIY